MIEFIAGGILCYLLLGFIVWAVISFKGGFMMPDGITPAPFWHCMFMTIIMWPAALIKLEIL